MEIAKIIGINLLHQKTTPFRTLGVNYFKTRIEKILYLQIN